MNADDKLYHNIVEIQINNGIMFVISIDICVK